MKIGNPMDSYGKPLLTEVSISSSFLSGNGTPENPLEFKGINAVDVTINEIGEPFEKTYEIDSIKEGEYINFEKETTDFKKAVVISMDRASAVEKSVVEVFSDAAPDKIKENIGRVFQWVGEESPGLEKNYFYRISSDASNNEIIYEKVNSEGNLSTVAKTGNYSDLNLTPKPFDVRFHQNNKSIGSFSVNKSGVSASDKNIYIDNEIKRMQLIKPAGASDFVLRLNSKTDSDYINLKNKINLEKLKIFDYFSGEWIKVEVGTFSSLEKETPITVEFELKNKDVPFPVYYKWDSGNEFRSSFFPVSGEAVSSESVSETDYLCIIKPKGADNLSVKIENEKIFIDTKQNIGKEYIYVFVAGLDGKVNISQLGEEGFSGSKDKEISVYINMSSINDERPFHVYYEWSSSDSNFKKSDNHILFPVSGESSGKSSGITVNPMKYFQMVKPSGVIHFLMKKISNTGIDEILIDTKNNKNIDKILVFSENGDGGNWFPIDKNGFPEIYDNCPVLIDMSDFGTDIFIYYCWINSDDMAGMWRSTYFPVSNDYSSASSGGDESSGVDIMQIIKPKGARHLVLKYGMDEIPVIETENGIGLDKIRAFTENGEGGSWNTIDENGFLELYDDRPVSIDMSSFNISGSVPVYYFWIYYDETDSSLIPGTWQSTMFPMSGESVVSCDGSSGGGGEYVSGVKVVFNSKNSAAGSSFTWSGSTVIFNHGMGCIPFVGIYDSEMRQKIYEFRVIDGNTVSVDFMERNSVLGEWTAVFMYGCEYNSLISPSSKVISFKSDNSDNTVWEGSKVKIRHNLQCRYPVVSIYDADNKKLLYDVSIVDENSICVDFNDKSSFNGICHAVIEPGDNVSKNKMKVITFSNEDKNMHSKYAHAVPHENLFLTFTNADKTESSVSLCKNNLLSRGNFEKISFQYDLGDDDWKNYVIGEKIVLKRIGSQCRFRSGLDNNYDFNDGSDELYYNFKITGNVFSCGSVMSLFDSFRDINEIKSDNVLHLKGLFKDCSTLLSAPDLPASNLSPYCYESMFEGCTSLKTAPDLPATVLSVGCYKSMFKGCTSLVKAPSLPAKNLVKECYYEMFMNCSSLEHVHAEFSVVGENSILRWLENVSSKGIFVNKNSNISTDVFPNGWYHFTENYLTFTSDSDFSFKVVRFDTVNSFPFEYRIFSGKNSTWKSYEGSQLGISSGNYIALRGTTKAFSFSGNYFQFILSENNIRCHGNIMSLVSFSGLTEYCFFNLFNGCTGLVTAPELPATTLSPHCYENMFSECSGLKSIPYLPAKELAAGCYKGMFSKCTGIVDPLPILPSLHLAESCYESMFAGCSSMKIASELPAAELFSNCYAKMFQGCTGILSAKVYFDTADDSHIWNWFAGCNSSETVLNYPFTVSFPENNIPSNFVLKSFRKEKTSEEGNNSVENGVYVIYSLNNIAIPSVVKWDGNNAAFSYGMNCYPVVSVYDNNDYNTFYGIISCTGNEGKISFENKNDVQGKWKAVFIYGCDYSNPEFIPGKGGAVLFDESSDLWKSDNIIFFQHGLGCIPTVAVYDNSDNMFLCDIMANENDVKIYFDSISRQSISGTWKLIVLSSL